jgi:ATP-binding cassette subfamily F protein uup
MIAREGGAALSLEAGAKGGKRVIEARGISRSLRRADGHRAPGPARVARRPGGHRGAERGGQDHASQHADRGGGAGYGRVTLGTGLELAVFDQTRAALDPDQTLWEALTHDPVIGASGRSDQVMVRGTARHVVGYLKDFLFDEGQARAPVRSLSGGEKARLLLARIMARQSNLLVLDEPTNDLDVETLDLLQETLAGYDGTVLLVSHDRDFLDRVATVTVALEGGGKAVVYAGGWSDMMAQRQARGEADAPRSQPGAFEEARPVAPEKAPAAPKPGLSFTETHRLAALPAEIARLEAEIAKLASSSPTRRSTPRRPPRRRRRAAALSERQAKLDAAEEEWLTLEEKAAG